jgi:hypothetical protein
VIRLGPDPLEVFFVEYWDDSFPGVLGIRRKAAINLYI